MLEKRDVRIVRRGDLPLVLMADLGLDVARVAVEYAREWGWDLRAWWLSNFEWPTDKQVAGVLFGSALSDKLAKTFSWRDNIPAVRIGHHPHPDDALLPAVLPDLAAQGRLAVDHFHQRGFKDVGFIGFNPQRLDANNYSMFVAFRQRAEALGVTCHLMSLKDAANPGTDGQILKRRDAMAKWLADLPKPMGIFTFADFLSVQAFMACLQAGLSVPEEVALLGCGNSVVGQLTRIPLSSIDTAKEQCIGTALQLLRGLMAGKPAPTQPVLVPPDGVVVRTSTDVLAVPDRAVAQALRFIWDHFRENLSIQNIADAIDLPRRSLERRFRIHLNRSVHAELKRKRVTELRHLLLTTHEPIADVAPRAGFYTLTHANRVFREAYGESPAKYRAKHGGAGRVTR